MKQRPREGMAALCNTHGGIIKLLRDDLGLCPEPAAGVPLRNLFPPAAASTIDQFFKELASQGAVYGWEVPSHINGSPQVIYLGGGSVGGFYFVFASLTQPGMEELADELMRMNNEQTNALRAALKELSLQEPPRAGADRNLYEELSRLNNELVTAQRELTRKNYELDRLNTLKNHFLGMASHDLRKPLCTILFQVDMVLQQERAGLTPSHLETLDSVRRACTETLAQLNDFLDIAQIESGALRLELSDVDFHVLVEERVARHRPVAQTKEITFALATGAIACVVKADARRLAQVLDNLIENALKYAAAGSIVKIDWKCTGERLWFSINNPGPAITPEVQKRLFDPFAAGEARPTGGEKSTGLGLAICRAIVEAHGGGISLTSGRGEGITVSFELPNARLQQ